MSDRELELDLLDFARALLARAAPQPSAEPVAWWRPIKTAPRDGTNVLLRWGADGVSQGQYVPGLPHPWKFLDTNDGITWLINHGIDGPGGPSHWMPMPDTHPQPDDTALLRQALEALTDIREATAQSPKVFRFESLVARLKERVL